MEAHQIAEDLACKWIDKSLNEADTRHQIIDCLLHEIMGWPKSAIRCEKNVKPGYMDYVLMDKANRALLVIEAKRVGKSFSIPHTPSNNKSATRRIRLKTLVTNRKIAEAVHQVSQYCPFVGAEFACITNGQAYIIFRTFIRGRDYLDSDALVISSLSYFSENFTEARELLSYTAIVEQRALASVFDSGSNTTRELFYPKNGIVHYDAPIARNDYAKFLEPIARKYFADIKYDDYRMMRECYVFARGTHDAASDIHARISDSLTPFFLTDGGQELTETRDGGPLAKRIAASLVQPNTDVLILYGGKGSGKSTFLRRLFYHDPPKDIQIYSFPIIVDFLKVPQDAPSLSNYMWNEVIRVLDQDDILKGSIEKIVQLFAERFAIASQQELSGLDVGGIDYVKERNRLVAEWRKDLPFVVRCLQEYWLERSKSIVVVFDNTDQLPPRLQDHCFLLAQNVARELSCCVIISMREERYCRARTVGVLDAYHNSGFHLAAPDLKLVFTRRLNLVIKDLYLKSKGEAFSELPENAPFNEIGKFFSTCVRQFRKPENAMNKFLSECSRDNTRLALQFFRQFITSGYTHVDEMVANPRWTVINHQVIKPMMIPERYNYDENKSLIPNIFQCRSSSHGSHFTALRILRMLRHGVKNSPEQGGYWRVDALCDEYDSKFSMRGDYESCLDVLLTYGLIEANNRLDSYKVERATIVGADEEEDEDEHIYADEVRITAFGVYMLDFLSKQFTYLDLVGLDCGISNEALYHEMCKSAVQERSQGVHEKRRRLESRVTRTESFVNYLILEEEREAEEFLLSDDDRIMKKVSEFFHDDIRRVRHSANRNYGALPPNS